MYGRIPIPNLNHKIQVSQSSGKTLFSYQFNLILIISHTQEENRKKTFYRSRNNNDRFLLMCTLHRDHQINVLEFENKNKQIYLLLVFVLLADDGYIHIKMYLDMNDWLS